MVKEFGTMHVQTSTFPQFPLSCLTLSICTRVYHHKGALAPLYIGGWPASLPYIRKIRVSVAIGTQSGIRLYQRVPMVKIWGSSKNDQNWTTGKLLKL